MQMMEYRTNIYIYYKYHLEILILEFKNKNYIKHCSNGINMSRDFNYVFSILKNVIGLDTIKAVYNNPLVYIMKEYHDPFYQKYVSELDDIYKKIVDGRIEDLPLDIYLRLISIKKMCDAIYYINIPDSYDNIIYIPPIIYPSPDIKKHPRIDDLYDDTIYQFVITLHGLLITRNQPIEFYSGAGDDTTDWIPHMQNMLKYAAIEKGTGAPLDLIPPIQTKLDAFTKEQNAIKGGEKSSHWTNIFWCILIIVLLLAIVYYVATTIIIPAIT